MNGIISKLVQKDLTGWDTYLSFVVAAMNMNMSQRTGYVLFFLIYSRHPILPIDVLLKPHRIYYNEDQSIEHSATQGSHIYSEAYE